MPDVAMDKISKAKTRLLLKHPFFASMLLRTETVITAKDDWGGAVDTAATDGSKHYINPDFLAGLTVDDVQTVMVHEAGHDLLLHSARRGLRDPHDWNVAGDHAINLMMEEQGFKCPKALGSWYADPQFEDLSTERIYDEIRDPSRSGSGGGAGDAPGPLGGDVRVPAYKDSVAQEAAEAATRQKIAMAAQMARMAGSLSGALARMVGDVMAPRVSWVDELREYMTKTTRERDNWARRNRRFKSLYLPSRRSKRVGPIVFVPDTSSSMWGKDKDLEIVCSELAHCAAMVKPESIRVVWADTAVEGEQEFSPATFSHAALKPVGGGGTDMRVALAHVVQYDPHLVILMTDGYTPWPDREPDFPLITVCTTKTRVPVGKVIRV